VAGIGGKWISGADMHPFPLWRVVEEQQKEKPDD
jgi:hypothetical protein